jgi:hypothetical protein
VRFRQWSYLDHLAALIPTAVPADTVLELRLMALRAYTGRHRCELVLRASLICARMRLLFLWLRHEISIQSGDR